MSQPPVRRVALLLFGSGTCALVYQIAWLRELRLVFGASTAASAAVLAIFMGGLGAGGLLFGKRAAQSPRPLALYARLEAGIAIASALTPLFVVVARAVYVAVGGTPTLGLPGGTVARLLLAAVVLGVPTLLMGGTLPAAAQAVTRARDIGRRDLAILYGANTLGAVAGAALATFVLLEALGTRRMLLSACALNLVVAALAVLLASRMSDRPVGDAPARADDPVPAAVSARLSLAAAAVVGFAFLLMELVWYRMLAPLLGGSSYTFGLILAVALAGIGVGGVAYALFGGRRAATLTGFALTCALEAAALAVPFALGDRIAVLDGDAAPARRRGLLRLRRRLDGDHRHRRPSGRVRLRRAVPAAHRAARPGPRRRRPARGRRLRLEHRGRHRRLARRRLRPDAALERPRLLAAGGRAPGRAGPHRPGARRAASPAVAGRAHPRRRPRARPAVRAGSDGGLAPRLGRRRPRPSCGDAELVRGVGAQPPPQHPLGGRRRRDVGRPQRPAGLRLRGQRQGRRQRAQRRIDPGDGRPDRRAAAPGRERALVVGLGTGTTAGWLGAVPTIERVDVVELEPAILEVARRCAPVNRDVLDNPRVHIAIGDAREVVGTTRARYDLIFSEPSNPYRAGIASLFTQEFYRAASSRLQSDGLFVQWLQAYNVDAQTIRTIYATLSSVFPEVETWITEESDLLLIAGKRPIVYDVARLRARITEEPWHTALSRIWRADDLEAVFARYVANAGFARGLGALEGDRLNTDDMTLVEFGFARGLGLRKHQFDVQELRLAASERGYDRPRLANGTLDRAIVAERAVPMLAADWHPSPVPPAGALPGLDHRSNAVDSWEDGDFADAVAEWQAQDREPEDSIALAALAESLADAGDAKAERYIARLRPTHEVEADLYSARLQLRQGHVAQAGATLERAFAAAATDPWPLQPVLGRGLGLAAEVATRDRAAGERLWRALAHPFAVHVQNARRLRTRVTIAWAVDWPRLCTEALAPLEPDVPLERELLSRRVRCYEATGDRRLAAARQDLERFSGKEPMDFANGLPPAK